MDQTDLWQVVPRQVSTPYFRLLISTAFVVVSCIGCHGVSGVVISTKANCGSRVKAGLLWTDS